MIVSTTVSGRPATVAYITGDFEPAGQETATLAKVLFQDGAEPSMVFLDLRPEDSVRKEFNPAEPRDDIGRWTSDGGDGDRKAINFGAALKPGLGREAFQPYDNKADLYAHSEQAQKELETWLDKGNGVISQMGAKLQLENPDKVGPGVFRQSGMLLSIAHPKSEERATEKTNGENGGRWDKLLDVVRAAVAVDKVSDVQRVLDGLNASGMQLARLPKDRISQAVDGGWRGDVLLNPRLPGGMIAELQIGLKPMYAAKVTGHKFYEDARSIKAQYPGKATEYWPESAKKQYTDLDRQMHEFYAKAWDSGAKEGMLKMVGSGPRYTYLEADGNYYRKVDGMVSDVLRDGEWTDPSPDAFAKAFTEGTVVSPAEMRLAMLNSRRGEI